MKKSIYLIVLIVALTLIVVGCTTSVVPPAEQSVADDKAPAIKCTTIQDGTLLTSDGVPIVVGYDDWGYNYQAHLFNGFYCDSYRDAAWCQPYVDVKLAMKWNDAWLSNKDCDGDLLLDRHYGYPSYIGSGAWLTNHQSGTYWSFVGDWVLELNFENVLYAHDVTFTTEVSYESFSGTGGYPSGEIYQIISSVSGIVDTSVVPNEVLITITYINPMPGSKRYLTGTIAADGTMSGNWTSNVGPSHSGTWESTTGAAISCDWNYFVKIVAVPSDAELSGDTWLDADGVEIGPEIWGAFAVVQEVENDACAGLHGAQYISPSGPGLGQFGPE